MWARIKFDSLKFCLSILNLEVFLKELSNKFYRVAFKKRNKNKTRKKFSSIPVLFIKFSKNHLINFTDLSISSLFIKVTEILDSCSSVQLLPA
jgi:hypothetical protein